MGETNLAVIAQQLNTAVSSVLSNTQLQGFEKAFQYAEAIDVLKSILTPEYMKPILSLQGNKLGFKTDKDATGGYSQEIVKNCLIEAVLYGLQPCGNQFNIIAGNMYSTKEGVGALLKLIHGLHYKIDFELPRISADKTSAAVDANVEWTINGVTQNQTLKIPVKVNQHMGADAVIGKATRKARKWLYDHITGSELPEGDVTDTHFYELKGTEKGDAKKDALRGKLNTENVEEAKTDDKAAPIDVNGQSTIPLP